MALQHQPQHTNLCRSVRQHCSASGISQVRRADAGNMLSKPLHVRFPIPGIRPGCDSLKSRGSVTKSRVGNAIIPNSTRVHTCTSRKGYNRRSSHIVFASGGKSDNSNPLSRPLAWLVDNIFPGLAPKLRQAQQQQQRQVQQRQQQRQQQQQHQDQQQSSGINAETPQSQKEAEGTFAPVAEESGLIAELQGNPQQAGFWSLGTRLGIFTGNGQRALTSVIQRAEAAGGDDQTSGETRSRVEDEEGEDQLSWESWDQYMQQMDASSNRVIEIMHELDLAITEERYEEAALLQKEADSFQAQNSLAVALNDLNLALAEERYEDAARIRDESFTNMVGWWAGHGNGDPFGHLMYICPSNSAYVGKVITGAQVAEYSMAAESGRLDAEDLPLALQQAGLPLLELFLRRDESAPHKMRHCSAVTVPGVAVADTDDEDARSESGSSASFRIELADNGMVQVDGTDLSQGGDNSQIQGVLEAIVTAISDNVASRSSGDSEKDSNSSTNDSDEDANAALEQASAAEVLESLRADIVRSLQSFDDVKTDDAVAIGSASGTSGTQQGEFKRLLTDALKQVGLHSTAENGSSAGLVINVETMGDGDGDNSNSEDYTLVRGRADLKLFGRNRFAIQACKDPWNPDAWNYGDDDDEKRENEETDPRADPEISRSLEEILLSLKNSDPERFGKQQRGDVVKPRSESRASSSPSATSGGSIQIADFEDSSNSDNQTLFSKGTRGRRRRPDPSKTGTGQDQDQDQDQLLRRARSLREARERKAQQRQSQSNTYADKFQSLKAEFNVLKADNQRLGRHIEFLQRRLKQRMESSRARIVRQVKNSKGDGGTIGSTDGALPIGDAGSQPDQVNTIELLTAGPITYTKIPTLGKTDDLEGVFLASFGDHGSEVLLMQRSTDDSGQEWVTAKKLTGDPNVPAGEISFRAPIGRSKQLPPAAHMEALGVTHRFVGEGRVASIDFSNPRWTPGELLQFSPNNPITRGAKTGIVWNLPGRQPFLVVLHRVKLEEEVQLPTGPNRGT